MQTITIQLLCLLKVLLDEDIDQFFLSKTSLLIL